MSARRVYRRVDLSGPSTGPLTALTPVPQPHGRTRVTAPHLDSTSSDTIRIVLTIEEAAMRLGIGRTTMYALVTAGEIKSVTIGRLRRIPIVALHDYVHGLLAASTDQQLRAA